MTSIYYLFISHIFIKPEYQAIAYLLTSHYYYKIKRLSSIIILILVGNMSLIFNFIMIYYLHCSNINVLFISYCNLRGKEKCHNFYVYMK